MHPEAFDFVARHATDKPVSVLELGGRSVNGSVRCLFPNATRYITVDIEPGEGVDIVADAATLCLDELFDVVICTEVLEHAAEWRAIIRTARVHLARRGIAIFTAAGPGRFPHSAMDGGELRPGEYYGNVDPDDLSDAMFNAGFNHWSVDTLGCDVRSIGRVA